MEEVRFVPATENDVMAIIELRKQVWITTYRGIYPDEMLASVYKGIHIKTTKNGLPTY